MKIDIKVPQQGLTVDYVTFLNWSAKAGDRVKKGDIIAEIESEKATLQIDSPADGVLADLVCVPGAEYNIGDIMGYVEAE